MSSMLRRLAALSAVLWLCAGVPVLAQQNASFYVKGEASLAASTSSNRVALVVGAPVIVVKNIGPSQAYTVFGDVTAAATTAGHLIDPGETQVLNPSGSPYIAGITASGSATLRITSGFGSPVLGFQSAGTINTDASANAQSLSGLNLLGTLAATAGRKGYIVQPQDTSGNCGASGGNANGLVISFDDGASGTATNLIIAYAAAKGGQGGAITWSGMPHTGRIRYYGTAGCQVGAAQW